jgi:gas vesicle protein
MTWGRPGFKGGTMSQFYVGLIMGLVIGSFVGLFVTALLMAAREGD